MTRGTATAKQLSDMETTVTLLSSRLALAVLGAGLVLALGPSSVVTMDDPLAQLPEATDRLTEVPAVQADRPPCLVDAVRPTWWAGFCSSPSGPHGDVLLGHLFSAKTGA